MLNDICYYYEHHSDLLKDFDDPTIFVKKIAAAHYIQLTGFVTHQLESIRSADWSGQDDRAGSVRRRSRRDQNVQREDSLEVQKEDLLEAQWGRFRCSEYVYDIEATLLGLGIPWGDPSATKCEDWRTSKKDFQYISRRLVALRADYDRLTTAMVGLGGMTRNRQAVNEAAQSLREAKTVKALTFIAMLFIPLEWIAALFSMNGPFSPVGPHFWVYFAVSGPTVLLAFVINSLIQLGYDEKATWSFQTFLISMQDVPARIGTAINLMWGVCSPEGAREDVNLPLTIQHSLR
jgi:CorA-like Mg2+ transporter protein